MKKNIGLVLVLALVVLMVSTYIKQEMEKSEAIAEGVKGYEVQLGEEIGIEQGQLAPDFTLTNLDGEEVTLSDLQGKNVLLNFWATWCPPCEAEMPHLQKYYDTYAEKDNVEIIGVNVTYAKEKIERVKQFVEGYQLTFPILLEPTKEVADQYEVFTIPSTFMIDVEGNVQRQIIGPLDLDALQHYVAELNT